MLTHVPPKDGDFVLKQGSNIFVSVGKRCDFFPLVLIQQLKLVPFVYQGLEELSSGTTTNTHIEAEADLQKCQVFVLVLPLSPRGALGERGWGFGELDLLTRAGMKGFLYLPLMESIPKSEDVPLEFLPPYATVRNAPNSKSLNRILRQDLLGLMKAEKDKDEI